MNNAVQEQLDTVLDRQTQAWRDGYQPTIEELLRDSSLPPDSEIILDLVYNELVVREELGEHPALEDFSDRFPTLKHDLKLHFDVHCALQESKNLIDTKRLEPLPVMTDGCTSAAEMWPALVNYEIVGELGRGGMGIVYKARHRRMKRLVAVKMFQPGRSPSPRELKRFRAEAEAVARLQHSNIVQIFEIGEENGCPYLVFELAEHGTLAQRIQQLPFESRAAAELVGTLAKALQHAHEHNIIHRDLKPANVLLSKNGVAKITDFGLAKNLDASESADTTRTGEAIGTPRYMAPEQAAGRHSEIGPATDVYALGTLLYECLTGQVPFVASTVVETLNRICHEEPASPRRLQSSILRDLETICLKCLHKQPGRRYVSALSLADDLQQFLNGEPIHARPTPTWERVWMWSRRHPRLATVAVMSVLLSFTGLIVFGFHRHRERQRLDGVRLEATQLIIEGRQALAKLDVSKAKERFVSALSRVQSEPELRDLELGIRGWLDHSLRDDEQQRWKKRRPPPLFEELRDEALLLSVIRDPHETRSLKEAREAIEYALSFTVTDDPNWLTERETLTLLEVDLLLRQGDPSGALHLLDETTSPSTRLWHVRRADCLDQLNRQAEAIQERRRAEQLPPMETAEFLLAAIEQLQRKNWAGALVDFERLLINEPDQFTARLLQGACFLQLMRPGEAKVALTACLAQRPRFMWSFLLRSQAYMQMGDLVAAAADLQRADELEPKDACRSYLEKRVEILGDALQKLPADRRSAFWSQEIRTESGLRQLRSLAILSKLSKLAEK